MAIRLTDFEISQLIGEPKPAVPDLTNLRQRLRPSHIEMDYGLIGARGSEFQIRVRQSLNNAFDFSVILMHRPAQSTDWFRLRRYNGSSHSHRNALESLTLAGFHRHTATERYQAAGFREDSYAEVMTGYSDVHGAYALMLTECSFQQSISSQPQLDL